MNDITMLYPDKSTIIIQKEDIKLRVCAWSPRCVRISETKNDFIKPESFIVCGKPDGTEVKVTDNEESIDFIMPELIVHILKKDLQISYYRKNGSLIVAHPKWGIELIDTKITSPHYIKSKDKCKMELSEVTESNGYRVHLRFSLAQEERIYGLGSSARGTFNRRLSENYLYQQNYKAPVPFFLSSANYGVLVDTGAFSSFKTDFIAPDFYTDSVDYADFYFICGNCADDIISEYRSLTGDVPMLPKWFYGYTQSKEHYHTQKELLSVLKEYRRRKVPLDIIVQDWFYWKEDLWSEKAFDEERYPDPEQMCDEIHKNGAHVMISVWPNTRNGSNQIELWNNNALLGDGEVYNVFDDRACDIYWKQAYEGVYKCGFDAWWCDCSEPYEITFGEKIEEADARSIIKNHFKKYIDSRYINLFSLLHCKNIYENQRKLLPEKRVINLTRSSYAGQQRYSGIAWSGDITGTWRDMRDQISEGINYCESGLPYWTLDIGGFFITQADVTFKQRAIFERGDSKGYTELYTRWIQYGCFLPMFRSHGTDFPREIWQFGDEGNIFYDTIKKYIELRYKLIPYIYSLAWMVSSHRYTLMRGLNFDFGNDINVLDIGDQYMFGPSFLVCPVTFPMYYDSDGNTLNLPKSRHVYLPEGGWYDYYTDHYYKGGCYIDADAPIDIIPLFVREGSIILSTDIMQYTYEKLDAPYYIDIWEGTDSSFTIYEDEGDGYGYEHGEFSEITLDFNNANSTLTIGYRKGVFIGMVKERKYVIKLHTKNEIVVTDIVYKGEKKILKLK